MKRLSHLFKSRGAAPSPEGSEQRPGVRPSEPLYEYKRLPGSRWIRLLVLKPGTGKLRCSITHRSVKSSFLKYEAISYAWGSQDHPVELYCDGTILWVGPNLAAALNAVRDPHQERVLWVDAVCINQKDLNERSGQVTMMGQIFSNAKEVLIWIGEDQLGEAEECFKVIRTTNEVIATLIVEHGDTWSIPDLAGTPIYQDVSRWSMVERLLRRSWFSRVWVLQEIGLARSATIHYGKAIMPWSELVRLAICMHIRADLTALVGNGPSENGAFIDAFLNIWLTFDNTVTWRDEIPLEKLGIEIADQSKGSILEILDTSRGYNATDDRDHIYAFLGHPKALVQHGDSLPTKLIADADYQISVDDLYFQVSMEMLQIGNSSWKVLAAVDHRNGSPSLDGRRASWIPRWDEDFRVARLGNPVHWYRAGGEEVHESQSQTTVDCESHCLKMKAIILETIVWVSGVGDTWVGQQLVQLHKFVKKAWEQLESLSSTKGPYGDTEEQREYAFSLTVAGGFDTRGENYPAEDDPTWHRHVYTTYRAQRDGLTQENQLSSLPAKEAIDATPTHNTKFAVAEYISDQRRFLRERRIILTSHGFYGLGHGLSEIEDQVAVIRGSKVPFLLRPVNTAGLPGRQRTYVSQLEKERGTQAYRLVGECYIQGIMKGEVIDQIDGANERGWTERDIVIV